MGAHVTELVSGRIRLPPLKWRHWAIVVKVKSDVNNCWWLSGCHHNLHIKFIQPTVQRNTYWI